MTSPAPFAIVPGRLDDIPRVQRLADLVWREHYPSILSGAQIDYMLALGYSREALLRFVTERGGVHLRLDLLRERRVDLFVTRPLASEADTDIAQEVLYHDELIIVCGAESPLAGRRRLGMADLADEAWIVAPAEIWPIHLRRTREMLVLTACHPPRTDLRRLAVFAELSES